MPKRLLLSYKHENQWHDVHLLFGAQVEIDATRASMKDDRPIIEVPTHDAQGNVHPVYMLTQAYARHEIGPSILKEIARLLD